MSKSARFRPFSIVAVALAAGALSIPASALASPAPHAATPKVFAASTVPAGSKVLGLTPQSAQLSVGVFLEPRDPGALARYAAAVSDVHSTMFRHYLARGAFAARFGPTAATITAVESFLRSRGLTVASLSPNHLDLTVRGDVAHLSSAFRTTLTDVRLPDGTLGRAASRVEVPSSIAGSVLGVFGLSDLARPVPQGMHLEAPIRPKERGGRSFDAHPRSIAGAPSACLDATEATELGYGGITDDQIASAYGVDGLYSAGDLGAGQSVAIFEMEPFLMSDVKAFDECYFGADHTSQISVIPVDGGQGAGPGVGEAALDVESVSALAPAATIDVYEAPQTLYGWVDNYNQIVSDDTARVISTSWGLCEQTFRAENPGQLAAENVIFEQAASQGQTVFAAAGDAGSDDCELVPPQHPLTSVDDPASQPYVVGVGGTTAINVDQPPAQQVWNNGIEGGAGGGGVSTVWTQPSWMPASADALSNRGTCGAPTGQVCRTVPDVSAFADPATGITIYYQGFWYTIGGTSESAPLWAAMLAEINASSSCTGSVRTAHGVGFAAPLLYDVASNPTDYASGFSDVTAGNNDILNATSGKYTAAVGYDLASGLGSPELTPAPGVSGPGLAQSLCAAAQGTTTPTVSSISPKSGSVTGGTPFTLDGSGFYSGGNPDVTAVSFGAAPAKSFTVVSNTEITGVTGADEDAANSGIATLMGHSGGALVIVTSTGGEVAIGPQFHYDVVHANNDTPIVFQVGPTGGTAKGGNTVRIYGSGFSGASKVTFGGLAAHFTVVDDNLIDAVAPSETGASCLAGDVASLGLCQTQVQVTNHGQKSTEVTAEKPYAGFLGTNQLGQYLVPPSCRCEGFPKITEYDYVTALRVTALRADGGAAYERSPFGANLTIDGKGFNVLTFKSVDIGSASEAVSAEAGEAYDINATGTEVQLFNDDPNPSPAGNTEDVTVVSLGGASNAKPLRFGPIPQVDSLSTDVLPTGGGTSLTITGQGFVGITELIFSPSGDTPPVYVLKNFKVVSSTEITLPSPSMDPGGYSVYVCSNYDCASGAVNAQYEFVDAADCTVSVNYPGEPLVTSAEINPGDLQPKGPVSGGTTFEIQGTNFGTLSGITVEFVNGDNEAVSTTSVIAGPAPTDPGATESILVTTPAALGGYPDADYVVVSNAAGSSPVSIAAYFEYLGT